MNKEFICKVILALSDFTLFFISLFISILVLNIADVSINNYLPTSQTKDYILIHFIIASVCVLWFWIRLRHYSYRKPFWFELKEVIRTLSIFFIIELAIIALSKLYVSRSLWVGTWVIIFLIFPLGRILLKKLLLKIGIYQKNTVIIGGSGNAFETYNALSTDTYLGFNIKFFVTLDKTAETQYNGIPILNFSEINLFDIVNKKNTQFIIALEDSEIDETAFFVRYLSKNKCRSISVIPTLRGLPLYGTDMSFLFSHDLMLLRLNNNLAKHSSRILKRTMDIVGSIAIIFLLSPLLLYLYFKIRKDGGNAIYGHTRVGQNGKLFKCLKFRSMVLNSQQVLEELLATDPEAKAEWDKDFKLRNDPRITKIGNFLRKTSLDELPQLFNVLKGEMSLVGPRPIIEEELERYKLDSDYYFMAKPGMTGLWQVSGRNDVDYETRVYFDAWYVKNWSLWNDIAILFKTINVVLKRDGAY